MKIYCDLDGVLVDLSGKLSDIYGINIRQSKDFQQYFFDYIKTLDKNGRIQFWSNLPKTEECETLWNFIKPYKTKILTACSHSNAACIGKKIWCQNNLSLDPKRVFCVTQSNRKQFYAAGNRVLIDDLESNIKEWRDSGGVAVHHTSIKDTINQLKKLGF